MSRIQNAKNIPLNERAGRVPDVSGALKDWYQPMIFVPIGKAISGGFVIETGDPINFQGAMMPHKPTLNEIRAQGERKWQWFDVFTTPQLPLKADDVLAYLDVQYRVMAIDPWKLYGFQKYTIILDYSGTISNLVYDIGGSLVDDGNTQGPAELVTE